jgi:hypothetical protein
MDELIKLNAKAKSEGSVLPQIDVAAYANPESAWKSWLTSNNVQCSAEQDWTVAASNLLASKTKAAAERLEAQLGSNNKSNITLQSLNTFVSDFEQNPLQHLSAKSQ